MRTTCVIVFVLAAGLGLVAADEETVVGPAECCKSPACEPSATDSGSPITLDVRVLEINTAKLKALGFDFATDPFISARWDAGFTGFLEALSREGLVQQDVTISQQLADGQSWETVLRWRPPHAKGATDVRRNAHVRIRPTLTDTGTIRLETACGGQLANENQAPPAMVEFTGETAGHTLGLAADFVAADGEQAVQKSIRLVVLITPHWHAPSDRESCPDLLAPRNVLNRHAAHTPQRYRSSQTAGTPADSTDDRALGRGRLELWADDWLANELSAGENDVRVTPENALLVEEPSCDAQTESEPLFFIKQPPAQKWHRPAPRAIDIRDNSDQPRGFHGMLLAA